MNVRLAGWNMLGVLLGCGFAAVGVCQDMAQAYARAESMMPAYIGPLRAMQVDPVWLEGDRFWYRLRDAHSSEFVLVDPVKNTRGPAFDHARVAAGIWQLLGQRYDAKNLPFRTFDLNSRTNELRMHVGVERIACDLRRYVCQRLGNEPRLNYDEVLSPDAQWVAFVRDHDLYLRSLQTGLERRLTDDGIEDHAYGEWSDSHLLKITAAQEKRQILEAVEKGLPPPQDTWALRTPRVLWSPDSRRLLSYRVDQRRVPQLPLVETVPPAGYGGRPILHQVRVPFPGDEVATTSALVVFDIETGRRVDVRDEPLITHYDPLFTGWIWWNQDSRRVIYLQHNRGYSEASLAVADAETGETRELVKEHFTKTFNLAIWGGSPQRTTPDGAEIFWLSSRDGWQHLYRYDGATGELRGQLTAGDWRVHKIERIDTRGRWVYFTAGGREAGLDPYYLQLYRVRFDGSQLQRLTPENAEHAVTFSPSGRYFLDRHSTVDAAPVTVLRHADGRLLRKLEQADIAPLLARGWSLPERFKAKGRDGKTDIYGVLYRPADFDPSRKYPVLDRIYGGPQMIYAPRAFTTGEPIAQLGFIVVRIDGMGTPGRSRAFQEVSYGAGFAEGGGLPDHIAVLRELASRYPYMDMERVGIFGHSGGGYATARAMFDHPDFFKVGVASAGSHDQHLYLAEWGEQFVGRPAEDPQAYSIQANTSAVSGLKGKLMLAHGEMDDDVPVANTMQLAHALIAANKDFDLLILPNRNHGGVANDPYFQRRLWDYFVVNLLGRKPPEGFRIGSP